MQDLYIEFLPPWVETNLQPAFYDVESGTVLQQTARMYAKINDIIKVINNYNDYQAEIDALQGQMAELHNQFSSFQVSVDDQFDNFMADVVNLITAQINYVKNYSDQEDAKLKEYIDNAIMGNIYLYNPASGVIDSLQNVVDTIYGATRTGGITATEYDALELTATSYDGKQITAYDYDMDGKTILTQ